MVHYLEEQGLHVLGLPGQVLEEHLVYHNAQGPDVAFVCVVVLRKDLGRHVDRHSH